MTIKYEYSVSTDFVGLIRSVPNLAALASEIRASNVIIALDHIDMADDAVDVWFKDNLDTNDLAELDTVIANHSGVPLPSNRIMTAAILEEEIPTGGHYQMHGYEIDIPAGGNKSIDISYPFPISILSAQLLLGSEHQGDQMKAEVGPGTIIGTLTQTALAGVTVLNVSSTVIDNIQIGYYVELQEGTNSQEVGRVIAIDSANSQITVETPLTTDFHGGTAGVTYVKQTVRLVSDLVMNGAGRIEIGETKIGASYLPANVVLRIIYINNDGLAKKMTAYLEYLY